MAERIRELRRSDLGKLLVAQQTTEAAIDSLFDPVIVADGAGLVTRVNPAAERLFGARADALGKPIDAVTRDPRIAQSVADVLRSQAPAASEDAAATLPWAVDGARRAFRIRSTPMKDADDRLVGVVTLLEDVTHLSEVSRAEVRVHRRRVARAADAADQRPDGHPPAARGHRRSAGRAQRDILQVCREDTARLDRLMRELLDLSKIESGAVTPQLAPMRPVDAAARGRRPAPAAGGSQGRSARGRCAARPAAGRRRPQPDRARDRQPGHQRDACDAGRRDDHRRGVRRGDEVAISVADTGSGIRA